MHLAKKLVFGIILLSILSATLAIPTASAAGNLWVWVKKERRYVTSAQSIAGSTPLSGTFVFSIGIQNPGPAPVQGATIALTSARDKQSLIADVGGVGDPNTISRTDAGTSRYTWRMPDILSESSEQVWFNTPTKCTFNPGFYSSREVTPTLLTSQTPTQQVRITVKPIQRFRALLVGISLESSDRVKVELVKGSDRPFLRDKSSTYVDWWIDDPQINRVYQFSLSLKLTNLIFPSLVDFVPWIEVEAYESQQVNAWSTSEWHGTPQPDPDLSVSDVTVEVPGNRGSNVAVEVVRTVGFWHPSTAQLKTTVTVGGLPTSLLGGLHLVVDGKPAESTILLPTYLAESGHKIEVASAIEDSPGVRYYCESNTVLLAGSDVSFYLKASSLSLRFNYVKQLRLQVYSWGDGNHTDQWLPPGSMVTVRSSTFVFPSDVPLGLRPFSVAYRFQGWQGTVESKSSTVSFALNQPTSMTALWVQDYSPIITTGALILICASLMGVLLVSRRRKAIPAEKKPRSGTDAETLLQRLETLKASGAISEFTYEKLRSEYERRRGKN
ncbi:MAG: hypothetical protein ABSG74_09745 [Candidatus Bathyarchaeia archaeon]|jgi:hypothetical protein